MTDDVTKNFDNIVQNARNYGIPFFPPLEVFHEPESKSLDSLMNQSKVTVSLSILEKKLQKTKLVRSRKPPRIARATDVLVLGGRLTLGMKL